MGFSVGMALDLNKMADTIKTNPKLSATLDAFSKGEFENLPKTKEALQSLADATGLKVDVLLTAVTSYQEAKGSTDKQLIAIDVNPDNRADTIATLGHEVSHARGGTSETLANMSGYATQLLSDAAIGSHDQTYLNAIKFEMGAGKDTQIQSANGVLLGNDNQVLLDEYNDHQMEFYLKGLDDFTNKSPVKVSHNAYNAKDVPPMPDYISITAGAGIISGNIAINLYNGEVFYGGGVSYPSNGKIDWKKLGASVVGGHIIANPKQYNMNSNQITSEFLGGISGQTGACTFGGCIGINASAEGILKGVMATEIGVGTPGASMGGSESQSLGNIK